MAGHSNIYHVFLPPGQDECFTATDGICYSPDVPADIFLLRVSQQRGFQGHRSRAVHGGTVSERERLFGAAGNSERAAGGLNQQHLSHEVFETITDPDGDAWFKF